MELTLGNILFFWPKQQVLDFYRHAKTSMASTLYLGESVCSKRRELVLGDWLALAKELSDSGKQVVLSSMALLEAKSELASLKKLCSNQDFLIEANDFAAVQLLQENKLPFVAGAALNIYNQHDLHYLYEKGMQRWVMPVELSRDWLKQTLIGCQQLGIHKKFEVEVFGYGYLPLAYGARCFTARAENLAKDNCQYCCIQYPQGREVDSQEGEHLFRLNGIQTLSGKAQNLINDLPHMHDLVDKVRISPSSLDSLTWLTLFKQNMQGKHNVSTQDYCNGYWHKIAGMNTV